MDREEFWQRAYLVAMDMRLEGIRGNLSFPGFADSALAEFDKRFPPKREDLPGDVWINWDGSKDLIPVDGTVTVETREGRQLTGYSFNFKWEHKGKDSDIIAYKVEQ